MLRFRFIISLLIVFSVTGMMAVPALASDAQEDPAAAKIIFSGISLLRYYSSSLDPVLAKDPAATETSLGKMPFVNIPDQLDQPTQDFAGSGIALSNSIAGLFALWDRENALVGQYRLDEADKVGQQIADGLPLARTQLAQLKASAGDTGSYLKVDSAKAGSELKRTYDEVTAKIQRLEDMLDLLTKPLIDLNKIKEILNSLSPEQQSEIQNNPDLLKEILQPTRLTLEVNPATAFVGDSVDISGVLSSPGESLGGREIEVLLNGSLYLTVTTDAGGIYQGRLQVPYWYSPELEVQAIFYPRGDDIGRYLGSSSPTVTMTVLYYKAKLVIQAGNPAYPGLGAKIDGSFDYGQAPPVDREGAELYLDDALMASFTASQNFTHELLIPPGMALGEHTLVVSTPADGRYAPASATCVLEVAQAPTILDWHSPGIGIIPGSIGLKGNLHSSIGPLQKAAVNIDINNTHIQAASSTDGSIDAKIKTAMDFSLLGSQKITIRVQPQEPWNAPLTFTRSIFMVNIVSCGILLVILVFLGIYLPRRVKKWLGAYSGRSAAPGVPVLPPPAPVYEEKTVAAARTGEPDENDSSPGSIFSWYRFVLKLVQAMTQAVLKPQQTLREYAGENGGRMGPAGRYFLEFTLLVERLIYSRHQPTLEDIQRSREMGRKIRGAR